jgi:hypothetical protein
MLYATCKKKCEKKLVEKYRDLGKDPYKLLILNKMSKSFFIFFITNYNYFYSSI